MSCLTLGRSLPPKEPNLQVLRYVQQGRVFYLWIINVKVSCSVGLTPDWRFKVRGFDPWKSLKHGILPTLLFPTQMLNGYLVENENHCSLLSIVSSVCKMAPDRVVPQVVEDVRTCCCFFYRQAGIRWAV